MRTSMIRAGLGFGQLGVTIRGTTKYHLSPMEQKAFAGAISQGKTLSEKNVSFLTNILSGLPNIFWRVRKSFFTVVPPFILSYLIFTETEKEHDRLGNNSTVRCSVQFVLSLLLFSLKSSVSVSHLICCIAGFRENNPGSSTTRHKDIVIH